MEDFLAIVKTNLLYWAEFYVENGILKTHTSEKGNLNFTTVEDRDRDSKEIYSQRVRAGKRTYFFDVKSTRSNDYYLTITESKRKYKDDGFVYEKHKIFLYIEDFNKFFDALQDSLEHVKTELLPDFDFDNYERNEEITENVKDDYSWD